MSTIDKDIEVALRAMNDINYFFPEGYSKAFLNTNEVLSEYFKKFPIENGKVLTVAASGDHILQAVCYGARKIDAFDINKFALYVSELKIAAMKALDVFEFERYFSINNGANDFMKSSCYEKIRKYLTGDSLAFWDAVYGNDSNIHRIVFGPQFHDLREDSYRSESGYYSTRKKLDAVEINYHHRELFDLLGFLEGEYDAVFLSNIYSWLSAEEKEKFSKLITKDLVKLLSDDGMIAVFSSYLNPDFKYARYNPKKDIDPNKTYIYKKNY